jgi:hypothetical protein
LDLRRRKEHENGENFKMRSFIIRTLNTCREIKSRGRRVGHIARVGAIGNSHKFLVGKSEGREVKVKGKGKVVPVF